MTSMVKSSLSKEQLIGWLRGLLTLAWADGNFDESEQQLICELTHSELGSGLEVQTPSTISAQELASSLGADQKVAENFLRTAVMVAIADGVYTQVEDQLLHEFCQALGLNPDMLQILRLTLSDTNIEPKAEPALSLSTQQTDVQPQLDGYLHPLKPLQEWLDQMEIHDPKVAHFLCKMIPAQCPFERTITLFGHKVLHIPPMCKLNPLYEQLVGLRFRSLSYLADECGEDISSYC